jgi:hypothetical protein
MIPKREVIVMSGALDEQLKAYKALLPEIKRKHGSVWALIANKHLVEVFQDFSSAAKYADDNFGNQRVLIKFTDETPEMAPFIQIGG